MPEIIDAGSVQLDKKVSPLIVDAGSVRLDETAPSATGMNSAPAYHPLPPIPVREEYKRPPEESVAPSENLTWSDIQDRLDKTNRILKAPGQAAAALGTGLISWIPTGIVEAGGLTRGIAKSAGETAARIAGGEAPKDILSAIPAQITAGIEEAKPLAEFVGQKTSYEPTIPEAKTLMKPFLLPFEKLAEWQPEAGEWVYKNTDALSPDMRSALAAAAETAVASVPFVIGGTVFKIVKGAKAGARGIVAPALEETMKAAVKEPLGHAPEGYVAPTGEPVKPAPSKPYAPVNMLAPKKEDIKTSGEVVTGGEVVASPVLQELYNAIDGIDSIRQVTDLTGKVNNLDILTAAERRSVLERLHSRQLALLQNDPLASRIEMLDVTGDMQTATAAENRTGQTLLPAPEAPLVGEKPDVKPYKRNIELNKGEFPVERVKVSDIDVRPADLQFKLDVNAEGVQEPLKGKWNELAAGNLLLWEDLNGDKFAANGHHRLAKAKEQGIDYVNAQTLKEADGYTIDDARRIAAESNILEGKGTIYDQAEYFRLQPESFTQDVAKSRGIAGRGYTIGRFAAPDTYTQFRTRAIKPESAEAISKGAPSNPSLQNAGVKYALSHPRADAYEIENFIRALSTIKRPAASADLFGFDDSAIQAAEKMGKAAAGEIRSLRDKIAAVQGAAKRPETARELGVDVHDPESIKTKIVELKMEIEKWNKWSTNPDLVAELRRKAGIETTSEAGGVEEQKPLYGGRDQNIPGLSPEETFVLANPKPKPMPKPKPKEEQGALFEPSAPYTLPSEKLKPFYSRLAQVVEPAKFTKMPVSQLRSFLKNKGVKDAEIDDVVGGMEGTVTKQQVMDAIKENTTEFKDVMLGDRPKESYPNEILTEPMIIAQANNNWATFWDEYAKLTLKQKNKIEDFADTMNDRPTKFDSVTSKGVEGGIPGTYRELAVTIPEKTSTWNVEAGTLSSSFPTKQEAEAYVKKVMHANEFAIRATEKKITDRIEIRELQNYGWQDQHGQYADIANPVIRIHFDDREVNGQKVLFIREMQSIAKDKPEGMPQWAWDNAYDIGVKRILAYAKENGYNGVAWSPGQVVADRYDLAKQISAVSYSGTNLKAWNLEGKEVISQTGITKEQLPDYIGKDAAEKLMSQEPQGTLRTLEGVDLTIGGEGIKDTYDRRLPGLFKKYGKEGVGKVTLTRGQGFIGTVGRGELETGALTVPFVPITDKTPARYAAYEGNLPYEYEAALDNNGNYDIVEARRKGYVSNQLELDLEGYGKDVRTAGNTLPNTRRRLGNKPSGVETIASAIPKDFTANGFISLVGTKAGNAGDIASVAQIFRNPQIETLRIFYVKEGKIAGHEALSSRMPGFVNFYSEQELPRQLVKINSRFKRLDADEVYLLHNHPGENPLPSPKDIEFTEGLAKNLAELSKLRAGKPIPLVSHVIIDHKKYGVLSPFAREDGRIGFQPTTHNLPEGVSYGEAGASHRLLGRTIAGQSDIIAIGQELQRSKNHGTLIYRSSTGVIRGVQDIHINLLKGNEAFSFLKGQARAFGTNDIFLYLDETDLLGAPRIKILMEYGGLRDVVSRKGGFAGQYEAIKGISFGEPQAKYGARRVLEERAPYDTGGYFPSSTSAVELPELVDFARELGQGKYPKVYEVLKNKGIQGDVLGLFQPRGEGGIKLKASIFTDPVEAAKTLAHEIGHWIDYLPDKLMSRGNILGRIASLRKYFGSFLEEYPNAPLKVLTKEEIEAIRNEARRQAELRKIDKKAGVPVITKEDILNVWNNVSNDNPKLSEFIAKMSDRDKAKLARDVMKNGIPEWFKFNPGPSAAPSSITKIFEELLAAEVERRHLWKREDITQELKNLSQEWRPFGTNADAETIKYRNSSKELYADAFSVLMNDPAMLEAKAPKFAKAFSNYLERKPAVKSVYEGIRHLTETGAVFEKRMANIEQGYARGEEIRKAMAEFKPPSDLMKWLKTELIDRNTEIIYRKKYLEKLSGRKFDDTQNPVYWLEELPYQSGEVFQYLRDIDNIVKKQAARGNISETELGQYMFLNRAATELKEKAVAFGEVGPIAEADLRKLRAKWGDEKYNKVQKIAESYQKIRSESVVPLLEKANMYSEELMSKIRDNKNYARSNVLKYLEDKYGKMVTGEVYRQVDSAIIHKYKGHLSPDENPLTATIMKDAALIRAANTKMAKAATVDMMLRYFPSEINIVKMIPIKAGSNTFYKADKSPGANQGAITYLEEGKVKRFYVPKDIADSFNKSPYPSRAILGMINFMTTPFKAIFVSHNPVWALRNIQRDIRAFAINVPEATLTKTIKAAIKAIPDAVKDYKGVSTQPVREMYQQKMLVLNRIYDAFERSPDTQLDRMLMTYGQNPHTYNAKVLTPFKWLWDKLEVPGKFSERLTKIAGYKFLKETGKYSEKEIAHIVRSRVGTPDIMRGGELKPYYNSLFLFSNVGKEGLRSAWESAKASPMKIGKFNIPGASYAWKIAKYDILPKTLMWAAGAGILAKIIPGMTEEHARKIKERMDNIPEHDKINYMTVPLGSTPNGSTVYMVMPHDFQGQLAAGTFWMALEKDKAQSISRIIDFLGTGLPYSSFNPAIAMARDWSLYAADINPPDIFRRSNIVPSEAWKARSASPKFARAAMLKNTWNKTFATSLYSFKSNEVERVKSELEEVLDLPLLGKMLGAFIRVSNRGKAEKYRDIGDKVDAIIAAEGLEATQAIAKDINSKNPRGAMALFGDLVRSNVIKHKLIPNPTAALGNFKAKYQEMEQYKNNIPLLNAIMHRSTEAKMNILGEAYKEKQAAEGK